MNEAETSTGSIPPPSLFQKTPTQLVSVLETELREAVAKRRKRFVEEGTLAPDRSLEGKALLPDQAFDLGLVGLALSGGGIRSATFNLGLLQALAKRGILNYCDYLSTVSGGGYIGSCLTSLCADGKAGVAPDDFPFRFDGSEERAEIKHLRQHGNYLIPRHGLLRLDTWRLVSTYLLGLLLTLATVVAILGSMSSLGIWVYPKLFEWLAFFRLPHLERGHDLWGHPWDHWLELFTPALLALAGWMILVVRYVAASVGGWNLEKRRLLIRWQGRLLRFSALLAGIGALPMLMALLEGIGGDGRRLRSLFWGTLGASALSLLRSDLLAARTRTLPARVKRWILVIGASIFMILFGVGAVFAVWSYRGRALEIFLFCAVLLVVLALITDINRISMFYFYRDRLSEAYIFKRGGVSEDLMLPNDALPLVEAASSSSRGPYPLINATVNLPGSEDLNLRGRKADFFLLSPLFCGSKALGYVGTANYEYGRLGLASAMAVSGAATNPQCGASTNPALAFLMALLNVRLGVWAQNPRYDFRGYTWLRQARRFWPYYLLKELLSLSDEKSRFVNLSDGGHIENLAVYELLRRRCKVIIAADASADPDHSFEDLGNLMRKARVDLGIAIDVNVSELGPDTETGFSGSHAALGRIHYPTTGGGALVGTLIYVKSSLVKDDPQDLHEYKCQHPSFPHETTVDQFFDEAQFESYRELGFRSGQQVCEMVNRNPIQELGAAPAGSVLLTAAGAPCEKL